MNPEFIQGLRYKLQVRVRKVHSARQQLYWATLSHLWKFLQGHPYLSAMLQQLRARAPQAETWAAEIAGGKSVVGSDDVEQAAIASWIIQRAVDQKLAEHGIAHLATPFLHGREIADFLESFYDLFVESLYDYLDEQLDDRGAVLAALIRYKRRTEWFHRDRLYQVWSDDNRRGEKTLALDLYEYLYAQGIDFYIEASSVSGEADLISAQTGSERLLADVKVFSPAKSKGISYLQQGLRQVHTYCADYNEPMGFLIVFKVTENGLRVIGEGGFQPAPAFSYNHKTVFVVVVDLYPHPTTASKRGPAETFTLDNAMFFRPVEHVQEGGLANNVQPPETNG